MRLTTFFAAFASILSITTAIPMASRNPTPSVPESLSDSSFSHIPASPASASAAPSASPNPFEAYTCPKGKFKSCCMSVQQAGKDITNSLGELLPLVGGLQLSSAISFQCKPMGEREAPDTCQGQGYNPMCCDGESDNALNTCKPFEEVKKNYYSSNMDLQETQADMIMDIVT